jgi:hypothetical protein
LQENAPDHSSPSDESDAQHDFSQCPVSRQPVTIFVTDRTGGFPLFLGNTLLSNEDVMV